jgi:hypothetical protein
VPKPKRHHTIPRVYLESFVEQDQRLTVWSKRRKNYLRPITTEALIRGHYYSQPVNGQLNADQSVESIVLNDIETRYPMLLSQLRSPDLEVDVLLLLETMLSFRARSVAFREPFELGLADYVHRVAASIPRSEFPPPPIGFEDIWNSVGVAIDPHRSLIAMAYYVQRYASILGRLEYSVRTTPKGVMLFTSDNPVVWYERGFGVASPVIYSLGVSKYTRAIFPISHNEVVVGIPSKTSDISFNPVRSELSRQQVREINELQLACAWDHLIGIARMPKQSWDRNATLAPRMEIDYFNPNTGEFWIKRNYLDELRAKVKYSK